jgi:polar amino acid transport system substrate-binding protein
LLKPQLRVGISPTYPPLAYELSGRVVGIEVDLANQLGKDLGKEMIFVETPWPELINALLKDKVDIIMSGMSITNERAQLVSFTEPYARVGQMALVRAKDLSSYSDLQLFLVTTAKVGFMADTTGEQAARKIFKSAKLLPFPTIDDGIRALRRGEIDVFIHDAPTVWRITGNPNEKDLKGLYWPLTEEYLGWAVRKEDEPLRFAINERITDWKLSGRLKQTLTRWVPVTIW